MELLRGLVLVCPVCHGDLADESATALRCAACGRNFPIIAGIPDLRLESGPYISLEADRAKALLLERECAGLDFAASVQRYYELAEKVPAFQARRFIRSQLAAAGRAAHSLDRWESSSGGAAGGVLLEIGCGTAPLLVAAATRYPRMVGVDIALRWLVMAQKRLAEAGLESPLVSASAESLPFREQAFDRIVLDSTIEHVRDQRRAFAECRRTLRAGGWMFLSTPNRFSLGPDPHTGLPAGGWLPDALTAAYVRRRGGRPPERRLLSAGDLRRSFRAEGLDSV
ncbi:MAG: class I SAM-dependent methyltransferase, partial [Gemmatimonadetes bacterium]|nr:class I SAM-dependent methyltransferase [Gemmatimonadota bacterium]